MRDVLWRWDSWSRGIKRTEYLLLDLISVCRISKSVADRKVGVEKKIS